MRCWRCLVTDWGAPLVKFSSGLRHSRWVDAGEQLLSIKPMMQLCLRKEYWGSGLMSYNQTRSQTASGDFLIDSGCPLLIRARTLGMRGRASSHSRICHGSRLRPSCSLLEGRRTSYGWSVSDTMMRWNRRDVSLGFSSLNNRHGNSILQHHEAENTFQQHWNQSYINSTAQTAAWLLLNAIFGSIINWFNYHISCFGCHVKDRTNLFGSVFSL